MIYHFEHIIWYESHKTFELGAGKPAFFVAQSQSWTRQQQQTNKASGATE